jgi:hypothetical protein
MPYIRHVPVPNQWNLDENGRRRFFQGRNREEREIVHEDHHDLEVSVCDVLGGGVVDEPVGSRRDRSSVLSSFPTYLSTYLPACLPACLLG